MSVQETQAWGLFWKLSPPSSPPKGCILLQAREVSSIPVGRRRADVALDGGVGHWPPSLASPGIPLIPAKWQLTTVLTAKTKSWTSEKKTNKQKTPKKPPQKTKKNPQTNKQNSHHKHKNKAQKRLDFMISQEFLRRLHMNLEAQILLNVFHVWYVQWKSKL